MKWHQFMSLQPVLANRFFHTLFLLVFDCWPNHAEMGLLQDSCAPAPSKCLYALTYYDTALTLTPYVMFSTTIVNQSQQHGSIQILL